MNFRPHFWGGYHFVHVIQNCILPSSYQISPKIIFHTNFTQAKNELKIIIIKSNMYGYIYIYVCVCVCVIYNFDEFKRMGLTDNEVCIVDRRSTCLVFFLKNLRERGHLEDFGVDERIIIKCTFKRRYGDWIDLAQDTGR